MPREGPLRISTRVEGQDAAVVEVVGELDMGSLPSFLDALRGLDARGPLARITIDVQDLTFADSSAINALIEARSAAQARGAELRLAKVTGSLSRLLSITGLDQVFDTATARTLPRDRQVGRCTARSRRRWKATS